MKIIPFSQGCGVVIEGVQIAWLTSPEVVLVKQAFVENGLIFFRDQEHSPQDHLDFAKRFSDIVVNKFSQPLDG